MSRKGCALGSATLQINPGKIKLNDHFLHPFELGIQMNKYVTVLFYVIMNRKEKDPGLGMGFKKGVLFISGYTTNLKFLGVQTAARTIAVNHIVNLFLIPPKDVYT